MSPGLDLAIRNEISRGLRSFNKEGVKADFWADSGFCRFIWGLGLRNRGSRTNGLSQHVKFSITLLAGKSWSTTAPLPQLHGSP